MSSVSFRRPLTMIIAMAAFLFALRLILDLIWQRPGGESMLGSMRGWAIFVFTFCLVYGLLGLRQRLACTDRGVDVTVFAKRHIAREDVRGFRAGSFWRGGTEVMTTSGPVWSAAPASSWGGPASAADLDVLEQARPRV